MGLFVDDYSDQINQYVSQLKTALQASADAKAYYNTSAASIKTMAANLVSKFNDYATSFHAKYGDSWGPNFSSDGYLLDVYVMNSINNLKIVPMQIGNNVTMFWSTGKAADPTYFQWSSSHTTDPKLSSMTQAGIADIYNFLLTMSPDVQAYESLVSEVSNFFSTHYPDSDLQNVKTQITNWLNGFSGSTQYPSDQILTIDDFIRMTVGDAQYQAAKDYVSKTRQIILNAYIAMNKNQQQQAAISQFLRNRIQTITQEIYDLGNVYIGSLQAVGFNPGVTTLNMADPYAPLGYNPHFDTYPLDLISKAVVNDQGSSNYQDVLAVQNKYLPLLTAKINDFNSITDSLANMPPLISPDDQAALSKTINDLEAYANNWNLSYMNVSVYDIQTEANQTVAASGFQVTVPAIAQSDVVAYINDNLATFKEILKETYANWVNKQTLISTLGEKLSSASTQILNLGNEYISAINTAAGAGVASTQGRSLQQAIAQANTYAIGNPSNGAVQAAYNQFQPNLDNLIKQQTELGTQLAQLGAPQTLEYATAGIQGELTNFYRSVESYQVPVPGFDEILAQVKYEVSGIPLPVDISHPIAQVTTPPTDPTVIQVAPVVVVTQTTPTPDQVLDTSHPLATPPPPSAEVMQVAEATSLFQPVDISAQLKAVVVTPPPSIVSSTITPSGIIQPVTTPTPDVIPPKIPKEYLYVGAAVLLLMILRK